MHLHRLTTHNLPSIRIHDQNSLDTMSDHHSSPNSQRSLPREIPIPKGSPASSRCGSYLGSAASTTIPPILSLDPPPPPPPLLPLDAPGGPSLPPPNNYHFRHPESFSSLGGSPSGSEGQRPRRSVLDIRDRGSHGWNTLSPIGKGSYDSEPSSIRSMQSEDSYDRNWREGFYNRRIEDRASPKELQSEENLRQTVQKAAQAYDRIVLTKLNPTSASEPASSFAKHRISPPRELRGFETSSFPHHQWNRTGSPRHFPSSGKISPRSMDSPIDRWPNAPGAGDPSRPGNEHLQAPGFSSSTNGFRSNGDASLSSSQVTDNEMPSSLDSRMRRSASASLLAPGYDSYNEDEDSQMEDAPSHVSQMNRLTLHDARTPPLPHQRVGSKRRASSPPNEDRLTGNSEPTRKGLLLEGIGPDLYNLRGRTPPLHHSIRASPSNHPKFFHQPLTRSASGSFTPASASSGTTMWSASIGQFSPATSSLSTQTDWSPAASYTPSSLGRPDTVRGPLPGVSSFSREKELPVLKHNPPPKMGIFICECCPKKPKKFDNRADLQLHEMEKQYSCQYCNNRFKNKNEAERHQNSLHLRKHSWSCASLAGNYEAAFHPSTHRPNFADVCGYCGKEFPVPAQWNARIEHLTAEHKFGECNQSKKFYRADHFRQHLKHSHSGTSGKWTNILENACMRDEIPPQPINRRSASSGGGDIGGSPADGSE